MRGKRIDEKTRQQVLEAHGQGRPSGALAREFGISVSSVRRIVRADSASRNSERDPERLRQRERQEKIQELERRIHRLEERIRQLQKKRIKRKFWK